MSTDALEYHERTKHSPKSVRSGGHGLNFENKPTPYKEYVDRPSVAMADRIRPPQQPALSAIAEPISDGRLESAGASRGGTEPTKPDFEALTTLCYYAAGITKTIERGGRPIPFRAAATTGALYHVDLYAVCTDLEGLAAGVYHFDPRTLSLDVVREGEYRDVLARATNYEAVADARCRSSQPRPGGETPGSTGIEPFATRSGTRERRSQICFRSPTASSTAPRSSPASPTSRSPT